MSKKEEQIAVNLDMATVTEVTSQYLMILYENLQKKIAEFIRERVTEGPTTTGAWEEYNDLHKRSQAIREILNYTMSYEDYDDFTKKVYIKYYSPK